MKLLLFANKEQDEDNIPSSLSHLSITLGDKFRIKEERGLDENHIEFETKQELIKYLEEQL